MSQTTLSVILEVQPASADLLCNIIDALRVMEENTSLGYTEQYGRIRHKIPTLHFMSISIFPAAEYDPVLIIEVNFDGRPGPFWAQFEAALGAELRLMLRCCKRPSDSSGILYDAVTKANSLHPIAPYLEARTRKPSVFHQGNRGMTRDRILIEADLFRAIRDELEQPEGEPVNPYRGLTAAQIHERLRRALRHAFPWLDEPAPDRITSKERAADFGRLLIFVFGALGAVSVPGIVMALVTPPPRFVLLFGLVWLMIYGLLYRMRTPLTGMAAPSRTGGLTTASLSTENSHTSLANPFTLTVAVLIFLLAYLACASFAVAAVMIPITGRSFGILWSRTVEILLLGLLSGLFVTLPAIVLWLRYVERHDCSHDDPSINSNLIREMARFEDRIAQNHMGSIVLVKPGVLRMTLVRAGHLGLGLLLRVLATDGYLGSMRTVHFAHWAFISNGGRLLFFSNFDHSWESYLDDFIEKAHGGLTLAWGSSTGFPPTRFLVMDGASHGRAFKAWARHSMVVSRFWYSAYKSLTVDQIERQWRIANGLRRGCLPPEKALKWARDL